MDGVLLVRKNERMDSATTSVYARHTGGHPHVLIGRSMSGVWTHSPAHLGALEPRPRDDSAQLVVPALREQGVTRDDVMV